MKMFNLEKISKGKYVVGFFDGEEFYCYGGYNDEEQAYAIAEKINAQVIIMEG